MKKVILETVVNELTPPPESTRPSRRWFRKKDPLQEHKDEIIEAFNQVIFFEKKYNLDSETFIERRYNRHASACEICDGDGNQWATLYITVVKPIIKTLQQKG